ncbi:MAG: hypothetical protein Q7K35_01290 [bacterium]|nr:hypothetical protein [bacterium]
MKAENSFEQFPRFQCNLFKVDWPLRGEEELLVGDMREATLKALNQDGKEKAQLTSLLIGEDIRPRVLRLSRGFEWFKREGYFTLSEDLSLVEITNKWKDLFLEIKR